MLLQLQQALPPALPPVLQLTQVREVGDGVAQDHAAQRGAQRRHLLVPSGLPHQSNHALRSGTS